jgi:hypothetical protein
MAGWLLTKAGEGGEISTVEANDQSIEPRYELQPSSPSSGDDSRERHQINGVVAVA